jgi:hypothetical protein
MSASTRLSVSDIFGYCLKQDFSVTPTGFQRGKIWRLKPKNLQLKQANHRARFVCAGIPSNNVGASGTRKNRPKEAVYGCNPKGKKAQYHRQIRAK